MKKHIEIYREKNKITVCVPTYKRQNALNNCIDGLLSQSILPDLILCVVRDTDTETINYLTKQKKLIGGILEHVTVKIPGHIPPIQKGIDSCKTELIAFIDDDAVPILNWIETIYSTIIKLEEDGKKVGGVCGRVRNYINDVEQKSKPVKHAGKRTFYGRGKGSMNTVLITDSIQLVDSCKEGNCVFKKNIINKKKIDMRLNGGAANGFGMELVGILNTLNYNMYYNQNIVIKHFPAPRMIEINRDQYSEIRYYYNYNFSLISLKYFRYYKLFFHFIYVIFIGNFNELGVLSFIYFYIKKAVAFKDLFISYKAGVKAFIDYLKHS